MLHTKFQGNRASGSEEKDVQGFCHIWAWQPSWTCYLEEIYKLSLLLCTKAAYEFNLDWPSCFREEVLCKC